MDTASKPPSGRGRCYTPKPVDQDVIIRQRSSTPIGRHNVPHFGASLLDYGAPKNRSKMQ